MKRDTSQFTLPKIRPELAKSLKMLLIRDPKARKMVKWKDCHWMPEHLREDRK